MGHASLYHKYADTVDVNKFGKVLVIGPGDDREDIDYWLRRTGVAWVATTDGQFSYPGTILVPGLWEYNQSYHTFDVIWATHVLEHSRNPGLFLDTCFDKMKANGHLFVSVPPMKGELVGGHMTLWTMGLLWYHLILAGFNVRDGHYAMHGYNIFAHVQPRETNETPRLRYDAGDLEILAKHGYFPEGVTIKQGMSGCIVEHNWPKEL